MLFVPGERVRITGVYEVLHQGHRAPHQGFLSEGDRFPDCQRCGGNVIFRLVRPVKELTCNHVNADEGFLRLATKN